MIKKLIKNLLFSRTKYQPLVKVLVFANRLQNNYRLFCGLFPKLKFVPVLKSNAYGHGLVEVADILEAENPPFFVVDSFYEAAELRNQGIKTPLLVIGYSSIEQVEMSKLKKTAFCMVSYGQLKIFSEKLSKPTHVHLKIDTGMHRQGILPEQIEEAIGLLKTNPNFQLAGICSHLADADGQEKSFTKNQIVIWNSLVGKFRAAFPSLEYWHLSNSAGVGFSPKIQANVVRLGVALYGFDQSGKVLGLKPCLALKTLVSGLKNIQAGDFVGYGLTFQAKANMKVAVLPVGYFEGVDRRLSSLGCVKMQKYFCPILGRVSMNLTTVDVTGVPDIGLGSEVLVLSPELGDKNSALAMAKVCNTIVYEILIHIPQHLRREVVCE